MIIPFSHHWWPGSQLNCHFVIGNSWRCLRVTTANNDKKITDLGATCHPRNACSDKAWANP
ncbi:hypothetical protein PGT21_003976 [Puccinia graminis f. sp. tritici]|uniref:Uncharacterized protein n=1 Tax=Puccinia graminis f. sp. tritici TaxID=56615 RepID=A0A5B0NCW3_PUCGR|nr:hypothetical protein PGT21_003976 [Puccinia graminis f. sp. tritici]